MTNPLPSYTRSPFDEVAGVVAAAVVDVVVTVVNTVSALQLFCWKSCAKMCGLGGRGARKRERERWEGGRGIPRPPSVWPDVEIQRSLNFIISSLESCHSSFHSKEMFSKGAQKSIYIWGTLVKIMSPKTFKNCPTWSHWPPPSRRRRHSSLPFMRKQARQMTRLNVHVEHVLIYIKMGLFMSFSFVSNANLQKKLLTSAGFELRSLE